MTRQKKINLLINIKGEERKHDMEQENDDLQFVNTISGLKSKFGTYYHCLATNKNHDPIHMSIGGILNLNDNENNNEMNLVGIDAEYGIGVYTNSRQLIVDDSRGRYF